MSHRVAVFIAKKYREAVRRYVVPLQRSDGVCPMRGQAIFVLAAEIGLQYGGHVPSDCEKHREISTCTTPVEELRAAVKESVRGGSGCRYISTCPDQIEQRAVEVFRVTTEQLIAALSVQYNPYPFLPDSLH